MVKNAVNTDELIQQLIARGMNDYEINIAISHRRTDDVPKEWNREANIVRQPAVVLRPRRSRPAGSSSSDQGSRVQLRPRSDTPTSGGPSRRKPPPGLNPVTIAYDVARLHEVARLKEKFGRIRLRNNEEHDHQGSVGKASSSGGQAEECQAGLIQTEENIPSLQVQEQEITRRLVPHQTIQTTIEEEHNEERNERPNKSPKTPEKLETDEDYPQYSQDDS